MQFLCEICIAYFFCAIWVSLWVMYANRVRKFEYFVDVNDERLSDTNVFFLNNWDAAPFSTLHVFWENISLRFP